MSFKFRNIGIINTPYLEEQMNLEKYPEKILKFSDWLKLEIEPYKVSLSRFKRLLLGARSNYV